VPTATEPPSAPAADRFQTSRATLVVDRVMTWLIKAGGIAVILAVCGIFVFILWQILPLFQGASVSRTGELALPAGSKPMALGIDEWGEIPFVVRADGSVAFIPISGSAPTTIAIDGVGAAGASAVSYRPMTQHLAIGTGDGRLALATVGYNAAFADNVRIIVPELTSGGSFDLGEAGRPLRAIAFGDGGSHKLVGAIQDGADRPRVLAAILTETKAMAGPGKIELGARIDVTERFAGVPQTVLVDERGESLLVVTTAGDVHRFRRNDDELVLQQTFRPFADLADARIASLNWLLGDVSLVATSASGANRLFSLFYQKELDARGFAQTKEFPPLPGGAHAYAPSVRSKAFVLAGEDRLSLRYGTSAAVRWEKPGAPVDLVALNGKYTRMVTLSGDTLQLYDLDDPHPQSSFGALFSKVHYEGADAPKYQWSSSGASDDFEPKLSMVPLLFGTMKATLYAMLFSVPIALLAAIYTAEFMHPRFRTIVKPTMEIMASLPSVVLGFLAAQWLAPLIDQRVPSVMCAVVLVPLFAVVFGRIWSGMPTRVRVHIRPGWEYLAFVPLLLLAVLLAWQLGPVVERLFFTVPDGNGGQLADFRRWWTATTGASYEQRNSLIVGFMIGFAVIPIIFTIADDALSNVPKALRSGSLALGASRWQTAMGVVVPTASAGIFSALMIGLGRAIGETMIVVMATGNTGVMDWNLFNGMRTLSANIAVELPEAAKDGTLYRALFLGAMLLFLMTFIINTIAEVLRQHLREKYKTV